MCRFDPMPRVRVVAIGFMLIACASALPISAAAQTPAAQDQPPQAQAPQTPAPPSAPEPAAAPPAPVPQAPEQQAQAPAAAPDTTLALSDEQISQLVAPIALYPDNLLAQVLTASTYPLEVVMAARWSKDNPNVKGDALDDAMQKQNWDPSVKGLTAVPQVLDMMSEQLDWTQQLGEAYLAQPDDISDAVQKLRAKAEATGNLKSSKELRVTRAPPPAAPAPGEYAGPYIAIEPAEPDVVYVPVYDPYVVYGGWAYPAYRPFYWRPRNYVYVGVFGFGTAFIVRSALWSRYDWRYRRIYIDVNRYNRFNRTRFAGRDLQWRHDPRHRGSVGYKNTVLRTHFASGKPAVAGVPKAALRIKGPVAPRAVTAPTRLGPPAAKLTPRVTPAPKVVAPKPKAAVVPKPKAVMAPKPTIKPKATTAPKVAPKPKATVAPRAAAKPIPRAAAVAKPRPAAKPAVVKKKNQP